MFKKYDKSKVFRDPVYGNILVEYELIIELIDTYEFQRLRRIRQLSGVSMVFHTAEHSRFSHSMGTYEMARKTLENKDILNALTEYEQVLLLTTALLHDIGHGPFSHAFEQVFDLPHEQMSMNIIIGNTEVNKALNKHHKKLAKDIVDVLSYSSEYKLVNSLISNQIDVDRMDYLLRDSFFTGTKYGMIDYEKIIRVMSIHKNELVFKESGIHTIESYLLSRYHMYWQVYYHPKARSLEVILESIYQRLKDLKQENYAIETDTFDLFKTLDEHDLHSYLQLDDTYINSMIKQLVKSKDTILSDLCSKFVNRKLFKYKTIKSDEELNAYKEKFSKKPDKFKYYFSIDQVSQQAYSTRKKNVKETKILLNDNSTKLLSNCSSIVKGLLENGKKIEVKIFYGDVDV